jgi:hypothetical protein
MTKDHWWMTPIWVFHINSAQDRISIAYNLW